MSAFVTKADRSEIKKKIESTLLKRYISTPCVSSHFGIKFPPNIQKVKIYHYIVHLFLCFDIIMVLITVLV